MKKGLLILAAICCFITRSSATVRIVNVSDFAFTPSSLTAHPGDTILWVWVSGSHTSVSSAIPTGAAAWNGTLNSTFTSYMYVPTILGTYNYYCSLHPTMMTADFTVVSSTGIDQTSAVEPVTVFPNPANGMLFIRLGNPAVLADVTVTDITGKEVVSRQFNALKETGINMEGIPSGTYFLRVMQAGNVYRTKVAIQ